MLAKPGGRLRVEQVGYSIVDRNQFAQFVGQRDDLGVQGLPTLAARTAYRRGVQANQRSLVQTDQLRTRRCRVESPAQARRFLEQGVSPGVAEIEPAFEFAQGFRYEQSRIRGPRMA